MDIIKGNKAKITTWIISFVIIGLIILTISQKESEQYESFFFRKQKMSHQTNNNSTTKLDNTTTPTANTTNEKISVIKSMFDPYSYEIYSLSNGIKVLIASADDVQKIGLAIGIKGLGSYQDPTDMLGLSHFTEHLLFTGSKNYDGIDEIMVQSSLKNGIINGMTMQNATLYPFVYNEVEDLEYCLKRYVDFVKYPLLKQDVVENELLAVHSEYLNNQIQGTQQIRYVLQDLADINHPYSKFDVGSVESLKLIKNGTDRINQFINTYYNTHNTYLTLVTDTKLYNQTKKLLEDTFNSIDEKQSPKYEFNVTSRAFNQTQKGQYIKLNSQSNITEFSIAVILDVKQSQITKSFDYMIYLFTDMMNTSFCTYLTKYQYVTDCDIMAEEVSQQELYFLISMSLTTKGIDNQFEISRLFYHYFNVISKNIKNENLKQTVQEQQDQMFKYQSTKDVFSYIEELGYSFIYHQDQYLLSEQYNYTKVDNTELDFLIEQINPNNTIFILRSQFNSTAELSKQQTTNENQDIDLVKLSDFINSNKEFDQEIKIWNIQYSKYNLNVKEKQSLSSGILDLQETIEIRGFTSSQEQKQKSDDIFNSIIRQQKLYQKILTKNTQKKSMKNKPMRSIYQRLSESIEQQDNKPKLIATKENVNLWFLENNTIMPGFGFSSILFSDPSITQTTIPQVYTELVADFLNLHYDAPLFYSTNKGLSLILFGETQYLIGAVLRVVEESFDVSQLIDFDKEKYEYLKLRAINNIYRKRESFAVSEIIDWMKSSLIIDSLSDEQRLDTLNSNLINFEDIIYWYVRYSQRHNVEFFIAGDITKTQALDYLDLYLDQFKFTPIPDNEYKYSGYYDIKNDQQTYVYRKNQETYDLNNYSIINYYQIGKLVDKKNVKISQIIAKFFEAYSFYYLRSLKQLGYVVFSSLINIDKNMSGIMIGIQGYRSDPNKMNLEIEQVLELIYKEIQKLPSNIDFDKFLDSRTSRTSKPYGLMEYIDNYWGMILNGQCSQENESLGVNTQDQLQITKKDVLKQYKQWFRYQSAKISFQGENRYKNNELDTSVLSEDQTFSFTQEILLTQIEKMQKTQKPNFTQICVSRKQED